MSLLLISSTKRLLIAIKDGLINRLIEAQPRRKIRKRVRLNKTRASMPPALPRNSLLFLYFFQANLLFRSVLFFYSTTLLAQYEPEVLDVQGLSKIRYRVSQWRIRRARRNILIRALYLARSIFKPLNLFRNFFSFPRTETGRINKTISRQKGGGEPSAFRFSADSLAKQDPSTSGLKRRIRCARENCRKCELEIRAEIRKGDSEF